MAHSEGDRKALGSRLAAARKLSGLTMEQAAKALTDRGYPVTKQGVGHWESGRNVPDAMWLRRLAKLYGTTLDALVWDEALTIEAVRFAAQYDALTDADQRKFRAMWLAFFEQAKSDAEVEEHLPAVPLSQAVSDQSAQAQVNSSVAGTNEAGRRKSHFLDQLPVGGSHAEAGEVDGVPKPRRDRGGKRAA